MKLTSVFRLVLLAMTALALGFSTSLKGDDTARKNLAHVQTLLRNAAWDGDTNSPPTNEKRTDLLKQADELLKAVPPTGYHGHLLKAKEYVQDAIDGVSKGASEEDITGYIHDAESEVRIIE